MAAEVSWITILPTGEVEEPSKRCGKFLMEMERFSGDAKEDDLGSVAWSWTSRRLSSESASLWSELGRRISVSQERSCRCCAGAREAQVD